jgi:hypothetical protein
LNLKSQPSYHLLRLIQPDAILAPILRVSRQRISAKKRADRDDGCSEA